MVTSRIHNLTVRHGVPPTLALMKGAFVATAIPVKHSAKDTFESANQSVASGFAAPHESLVAARTGRRNDRKTSSDIDYRHGLAIGL